MYLEIQNYPKHQTIIYHPSILPAHRGASAISWTLINGDEEAGLSIFWADDGKFVGKNRNKNLGLDTGPILLQRKCQVEENDTLNSLYKRFLYPEGVQATVNSINTKKYRCFYMIFLPIYYYSKQETYIKKLTKV